MNSIFTNLFLIKHIASFLPSKVSRNVHICKKEFTIISEIVPFYSPERTPSSPTISGCIRYNGDLKLHIQFLLLFCISFKPCLHFGVFQKILCF